MIVNVLLNNQFLTKVSVGKGHQSIKWLSFVIQQRIKEMNLLRHIHDCLVISIKNTQDELINPIDLIYEHQIDGNVTVVIEVNLSIYIQYYEYTHILCFDRYQTSTNQMNGEILL